MKEYLCFDIEANGLKPDEIFMIVITDLLTRERKTYVGLDEVCQAIARLMEARMVVGHGIKIYDLKVMKKLAGANFDDVIAVDTVEMSRDLCELKNHKLETWGEMVGLPKLPSPPFDVFTEQMVPYCERDVDLNVLVFDTLVEVLLEGEKKAKYRPIVEEYQDQVAKKQQLNG